ncbi:DUF222 domain-containing protein [Brachybacterium sp. EF45031]|uniref:HNH endonuclease signature motif containing protein n=1 Tax=Brachybacterium sillae TaxID=2810536 RepID=UPI00217D06B5|nr:HNH endonuclease signature motif containing protein [Brachybacterium sillae]MCS6711521.1 DUF222 domain-containing protein [Brachybacterium sillae]
MRTATSTGPGAPTPAEWIGQARALLEAAAASFTLDGTPPPQGPAPSDRDRIEAIAALEGLRGAVGALQARLQVAFRDAQVEQQREQGVRPEHLGRGIADQIALARRISPSQEQKHLDLNAVLVESLPQTLEHLASGTVHETAAHEVAKAVRTLGEADRAAVDRALAEDLPTLTPRQVARSARAVADRLQPTAMTERHRVARDGRCVLLQHEEDGMVRLSALLPVEKGVAAHAALESHARARLATGDERTRGQIMADVMAELLLHAAGAGRPCPPSSRADDVDGRTAAPAVGIEVQLIMTDLALLGGDDETAQLNGIPVPAAIARHLALGEDPADPTGTEGIREGTRWIRRLYTHPATGDLRATDPRRRTFPADVRRFLTLRERTCRHAHCDAPVRDIDHVQRYADGGETVPGNAVATCQRHNLATEMPGWRKELHTDPATGATELRVTTPTGHRYTSTAPRLRGPAVGDATPEDDRAGPGAP